MDEVLDVLDLLADFGFEGAIVWILRVIGVLSILAGIGVWLLTDITLLVPAVLVVGGLLLVVVPSLLVGVAELA